MSEYTTLVEMSFDSGTRYYSFEGISAPAQWYKNQLVDLSQINRETSMLGGDYRAGDVTLNLSNVDKEFSQLKAATPFRNRTVKIKFGDLALGLAALTTVFTGTISDWEISQLRCMIRIRDTALDPLKAKIDRVLNRTNYPTMPADRELRLLPILYGALDSSLTSQVGAVPSYLVTSAAPWRYILAPHYLKDGAPVHVYRYGSLLDSSLYTVETVSYRRYPYLDLVLNSSFENTSVILGSNWDPTSGFTIQTDNSKSRSGGRYLQGVSPTPGFSISTSQTGNNNSFYYVPCQPGDQVYVEGYGYREAGDGTVFAEIWWFDSSQSYITANQIGTVTAAAWTLMSGTFTAPANACYFNIKLFVSCVSVSTTGRFDDFNYYFKDTHSFVTFTSDQRDPNRPNELEITFDANGLTADATASGTLIDNPVDQLKDFLRRYARITVAQIDDAAFTTARGNAALYGYTGALAVIDQKESYLDVINSFCESFNLSFYVSRAGKLAVYLFSMQDLTSGSIQTVTDESDIVKNTFRVLSNPEGASRLQYNYSYQWVKDYFERQPDYVVPAEAVNQGLDVRANVNQWAVRSDASALAAAQERLYLMRENQQLVEFELPISFFTLDLNTIVKVQHWQGIAASGGYTGQYFRILALELDLNPSASKMRVLAMKITDASDLWFSYCKLDDAGTAAANWGVASAAQKQYAYLGDSTVLTGSPKGTLGASDPAKILY